MIGIGIIRNAGVVESEVLKAIMYKKQWHVFRQATYLGCITNDRAISNAFFRRMNQCQLSSDDLCI